ncbi:hypothetical protein GUJ93_ZPchr0013g37999 [Zizania palustris]|uniref:Hydroxymethylglutaryl-coenzyme A synthase C-terminal domain-containing protein n=1 Tax=Zizania palustris TaxID=103762 RepID=A0A8J5WY41_ZIZPA|nr:hypothetical protein GUJ93_ZPchr0013g37999 [Zizania palustris]
MLSLALDSCYNVFCKKYEKLEGKQFSIYDADYVVFHSPYNKACQQVAKHLYDSKVQPTTLIPKQVGNMYTASLYAALASVIHNKNGTLAGQRIVMFSYGSGLTSTMFSFKINEGQHPFSLSNIASILDVSKKLESRHVVAPEKFVAALKLLEHRYGTKDFAMSQDTSLIAPGTYYLTQVDHIYRTFYAVKGAAPATAVSNGH